MPPTHSSLVRFFLTAIVFTSLSNRSRSRASTGRSIPGEVEVRVEVAHHEPLARTEWVVRIEAKEPPQRCISILAPTAAEERPRQPVQAAEERAMLHEAPR